MAKKVPDSIKKRVIQRPDAFRKQLSRARRHFAQMLVNEIRQTLEHREAEDVLEELRDLGLMEFVRDFLPEPFRGAARQG